MRRGGCPHPPAAPTGAEHPRGGLSKGIFRAPARGTFALGGKSTQKRRSNLRFENPFARLHPPRILTAFATRTLCRGNFTEMLHCLCFSFRCRFCSEMQSCAVLYLVCRGGVLRCGAKRNKYPWGASPRRLTTAPLALFRRSGRPCPPFISCHSEPVTDVTGVGISPPCLPLRGGPVLTLGCAAKHRRGNNAQR